MHSHLGHTFATFRSGGDMGGFEGFDVHHALHLCILSFRKGYGIRWFRCTSFSTCLHSFVEEGTHDIQLSMYIIR